MPPIKPDSGLSDLDILTVVDIHEAADRARAKQTPIPNDMDFDLALCKLGRVIDKQYDLKMAVGRERKATLASQDEVAKNMAAAVQLLDEIYSDLHDLTISRSWGVQKSQPSKKTRKQQGQSKRRRP